MAAQRLEEQQRKPALALADSVAALGGRVDEVGLKVEGLEALGTREREASEVRLFLRVNGCVVGLWDRAGGCWILVLVRWSYRLY